VLGARRGGSSGGGCLCCSGLGGGNSGRGRGVRRGGVGSATKHRRREACLN
jgi:hypothetical protein